MKKRLRRLKGKIITWIMFNRAKAFKIIILLGVSAIAFEITITIGLLLFYLLNEPMALSFILGSLTSSIILFIIMYRKLIK